MDKEIIAVSGIDEENELISELKCECGGGYSTKLQSISDGEIDGQKFYLESLVLECDQCRKTKNISFDITSAIVKNADESDIEVGMLSAGFFVEKRGSAEVEETKAVSVEQEIPLELGQLFSAMSDISDKKQEDEREGKSADIAQFCVPYRQLMDIAALYEKRELTLEETQDLIDEVREYIDEQMGNFENDEGIETVNPSLADANGDIQEGLRLIFEGYDMFEEFILKKEEASNNPEAGFVEERLLWQELADEGNELINQGKYKILNMEKGA